MIYPTPEQLAFVFATMSLRRGKESTDGPAHDTIDLPNSIYRVLAIVVVGFATGLLGLSYVEGTVAAGGRSDLEIRDFHEPSPHIAGAMDAGIRSPVLDTPETASAN